MPVARLVAATCLVATGCGPTGNNLGFTIDPAHGSASGQYAVTVHALLGSISGVTVDGAACLFGPTDSTSCTVQGALDPGPAEVIVSGASAQGVSSQEFAYDPPPAHVPTKWAAFGASLTHGAQSSGIDAATQRAGVSAQVAKAFGVYLGLPLFTDAVTPPLEPTDFNPDCSQKPNTGAGFTSIEGALIDPDSHELVVARGRLDPHLVARNLAVGGATVSDIAHGEAGGTALLAHLVRDPLIDAGAALTKPELSQIDWLEMLDPDVAFSTDLMANDCDRSVLQGDDLHPDLITPLATLGPLLDEIAGRLGKLHGQFFVANMPSLTFVPNVAALEAKRLAAGTDTADTFAAKVKAIDDATAAMNARLVAAIAPYPNLHLIDFAAMAKTEEQGGVRVGGELLTVAKFGGLLSLDDLHFTNTAYALYANAIVDTINPVLGSAVAHVDVEAVHAQDPLAPSRLRALGFTCVPEPM